MKPLGKTGGQHTKRTTRKLLRYSVAMGLSAAIGAWALSYFAQGRIDNMERNTNKKQKDTPQLFRRREIERKIAAEKVIVADDALIMMLLLKLFVLMLLIMLYCRCSRDS
eukprot:TRINITY_DN3757_c0_g1_i1.p2 TRINITY_DN3757_c0_g1~~TRINITY_DN3757_c0_g1_i1.p2  ORF type:complete len:110 (+),score=14.65 TRINITY_DN3757_c0_g1_i1:81-410(+)